MKLNYNCIRDILLAVEVLHSLDSKLDLNIYYRYEQLQDYSIDDIQFNSQVLMENEFISGLIFETTNISEAIFITDLEKKGQVLLDFIRHDVVFNGTKYIIKTVGTVSLSTFQSLTLFVAEGLLKDTTHQNENKIA